MQCISFKRIFKARSLFSLAVVVILFLLVGIVNPDFLGTRNLMQTVNSSVVFALLSIGIAFVLIIGEIDVSVGAVMGLTAAVSATLIRDGSPWTLAILAAVGIGIVCGLINGYGLVYLGIPSIIMTLGMNGVIRGLIYVYTGGKWVENIPFEYKAVSQATVGGITYIYLATFIIAVGGSLLLRRIAVGRNFYAVGDNIGGAELVGIPVKRTRISAFVLSSFFAAAAGCIYVSRIGFVTPIAGNGYEMKAIAACVLGGISLSGGVGSLFGALIGAIIMASIDRILVFLKFSSDYDSTITGILLITIVTIDGLVQHYAAEKARRTRLLAKTAGTESR